MVSRDHHDPNPRLLATANRIDRIGTRRVHHAREPEKGEVHLEGFLRKRGHLALEFTDGKSDYPKGPRGQFLIPEQALLPIVLGQRLSLAVDDMMRTGRQDPFGCAFDMQHRQHAREPPESLRLGQRENLAKLRS